jgi:very-short-patch-repair endonuclease
MAYQTNQRLGNNIYYNINSELLRLARENRKHMTTAEMKLWEHLKGRKLNGFKFRRQHPIFLFIADFYCHEAKLIIEIDGGYHDDPEQVDLDIGREKELNDLGIRIIRFQNQEIVHCIASVLDRIREALHEKV